ncbi:UNVERIFIED_CONTAM: E3 ubiquitin-protein ligase RZFP34 [Sesamum latifolium]|uniref:E3 ubiquitin-protein ligase RZFP34 n=1 Tax=Sesamum latifolium TaxID=2727402 RepID=A0AAW2SND1_9LAMI
MESAAVDHSGIRHAEPKISGNMLAVENKVATSINASESNLQPSPEEHIPAEESLSQGKITGTEALDKGYLKYRCSHYRRRCQIRAPCCNQIFDCRHCHNEAKNNICVDQKLRHDVPRHLIEKYLFDSRNDVIAMPCGHTIHKTCLVEMQEHYKYACPICSKSVCDMSKVWEKFDLEIAATPMPTYYENKMVWILCNDCGSNSEVKYHVIAQKCPNCKSYNTRQTRGLDR